MLHTVKVIFITVLLLSICSCDELFIGEIEENTPLNTFDYFGQEFHDRYGLFAVRNLDWSEMLAERRMDLAENPTEDNLYLALTGLVDDLDDSHVSLSHPTGAFPSYEGGIYGRLERQHYEDFDFEIVKSNYLNVIDSVFETIYYGTIDEEIGYIWLPEISDEPEFYESYIPVLLNNLKDTKGLIIDIRNNDGGEDEGARTLAGFFATERIHYMISRYKTGPDPDDFEQPRNWYIDPYQEHAYTKPIVLLTNRYSISAAETFSLAMKSLSNVTQVGDTTTGAFSDAVSRELPNGWGFTISVGDYRDAKNVSYEGIGLAPDVFVKNDADDLSNGVDKMLETSITILR